MPTQRRTNYQNISIWPRASAPKAAPKGHPAHGWRQKAGDNELRAGLLAQEKTQEHPESPGYQNQTYSKPCRERKEAEHCHSHKTQWESHSKCSNSAGPSERIDLKHLVNKFPLPLVLQGGQWLMINGAGRCLQTQYEHRCPASIHLP